MTCLTVYPPLHHSVKPPSQAFIWTNPGCALSSNLSSTWPPPQTVLPLPTWLLKSVTFWATLPPLRRSPRRLRPQKIACQAACSKTRQLAQICAHRQRTLHSRCPYPPPRKSHQTRSRSRCQIKATTKQSSPPGPTLSFHSTALPPVVSKAWFCFMIFFPLATSTILCRSRVP